MIIADLAQIVGRTYPARRRTQNLVGGASPVQATAFSAGNVTLEPNGGQVPWHNQEQEEVYFIVQGTGEMCLGEERTTLTTGQAVYIPSGVFHQLTISEGFFSIFIKNFTVFGVTITRPNAPAPGSSTPAGVEWSWDSRGAGL